MAKPFTIEQAEQTFIELVRIPSITGQELAAVEYLEGVLDAHEVKHTRIAKHPARPNLLAVIRAKEAKAQPVVLISHIDVVAGDAAMWEHPVFGGVVAGGRIYGRGTLDTKQLTIMELYAFLQLDRENLCRDVYFLATADEEAGSEYGMAFVKQQRPELFRGAVVLNEGGGFPLKINGQDYMTLTVGEKAVCRVLVWADGQGGHASSPGENQAVQKLAQGMERIFAAEPKLSLGSRATQKAMLQILGNTLLDNPVAADIYAYAGQCSIGMRNYQIGERSNVLPTKAEAILEFKVLPYAKAEDVLSFVEEHLAGTQVQYELMDYQPGFESNTENSPLQQAANALQKACALHGANYKVLPMLALGRTDGRFFGAAGSRVYGCSPVLLDDSFDVTLPKVHSHNESISRNSFLFGCKVVNTLLREHCKFESATI